MKDDEPAEAVVHGVALAIFAALFVSEPGLVVDPVGDITCAMKEIVRPNLARVEALIKDSWNCEGTPDVENWERL